MPQPDFPLDQILQDDCLDALQRLPQGSVDLIFADPPYNLQLQNELWRPNLTRVDAVDDDWDQFTGFEEYDRFTRLWLTACRRVLKDTGTLWVIGSYHNIYRVGAMMQELGFWFLNDVVWIKNNPMPNFHGVRFTNAHETLLWVQKTRGARYTFNYEAMKAFNEGDPAGNDLQMRSDWYLPLCTGKERIKVNGTKAHTTQKPEALLYRVILASSQPGDVVLDPFFGTGTTGAVAKRLHRHWIGIEKEAHYVEIARQRLETVQPVEDLAAVALPMGRRRSPRVSLGMLLERGLLQPGGMLYLGENGGPAATIQADGHLRCGELTGSIHKLAQHILQAPCNGWLAWYFEDPASGKRLPLDNLRQMVFDEFRLRKAATQSTDDYGERD